jgi:hypothetical protein
MVDVEAAPVAGAVEAGELVSAHPFLAVPLLKTYRKIQCTMVYVVHLYML